MAERARLTYRPVPPIPTSALFALLGEAPVANPSRSQQGVAWRHDVEALAQPPAHRVDITV